MSTRSKSQKQRQFSDWYTNLSVKEHLNKRSTLMQILCIKPYTISDYMNGRSEIPSQFLPIINRIAGKEIFT